LFLHRAIKDAMRSEEKAFLFPDQIRGLNNKERKRKKKRYQGGYQLEIKKGVTKNGKMK